MALLLLCRALARTALSVLTPSLSLPQPAPARGVTPASCVCVCLACAHMTPPRSHAATRPRSHQSVRVEGVYSRWGWAVSSEAAPVIRRSRRPLPPPPWPQRRASLGSSRERERLATQSSGVQPGIQMCSAAIRPLELQPGDQSRRWFRLASFLGERIK